LFLAASLALITVFPDLSFRRPLACLSTATMRDFSIVISCSLWQRVAKGLREDPMIKITRNGGIGKAERAARWAGQRSCL
jgi:hypothetical protein